MVWPKSKIKDREVCDYIIFYSFYISTFMEFFAFFSCGFKLYLVSLKQGLCINLEGWGGEGDGRKFQREGIYVYLWLNHVEV